MQKMKNFHDELLQPENKIAYTRMLWHIIQSQIIPAITFSPLKLSRPWAEATKESGFSGTTHDIELKFDVTGPSSRIVDGQTLNLLMDLKCKFYSSEIANNIVEF